MTVPCKPDLKPLFPHEVNDTVTECLIEAADCIRQIATDFGLRPYRVFLVWIEWTADENDDGFIRDEELDLDDKEVGVGRPVLLQEIEILPTPLVRVAGISKRQDAVGLTESGSISITEISARFREDVLMGLLPQYRHEEYPETLRKGVEFFWEIREDRPTGYVSQGYVGCPDRQDLESVRRRFHVAGTPNREADNFQWVVQLTRADGERNRQGAIESVA